MLEGSLERLGVDEIDIYWIHNSLDVERWSPYLIPALKSGKVKAVGVSNHSLEQVKRVNEILATEGFKIDAVQNHFSLLYRNSIDDGLLDYCKANNITFFAYMVLEQGALSGKYNAENPLLEGSMRASAYNKVLPQLAQLTETMSEMGKSQGVSAAQVALAWAIHKGTLPIVGATKVHHVTDAAKAAQITLTEEQVAQLEQLAKNTGVDPRGGWEGEA